MPSTGPPEERERPFLWRFWRALPPKGQDRHPVRQLVFRAHRRPDLRAHQEGHAWTSACPSSTVSRPCWPPRGAARQVLVPPFPVGQKRLKAPEANPTPAGGCARRTGSSTRIRPLPGGRAHVAPDQHRHCPVGDRGWLRPRVPGGARWGGPCWMACKRKLDAIGKGTGQRLTAPPAARAGRSAQPSTRWCWISPWTRSLREAAARSCRGRPRWRCAVMPCPGSLVLVFEGMDAAVARWRHPARHRRPRYAPVLGDPDCRAWSDEGRAQPYLWRFWRRLPREGKVASSTAPGTGGCWWSGRGLLLRRPTGCGPTRDQRFRGSAGVGGRHRGQVLAVGERRRAAPAASRPGGGLKRYKITAEDWRNRKMAAYEPACAT